jgi:hypothetical protein
VLQKQPLPGIEAREFLRSFNHSKIYLFESISVPDLGKIGYPLRKYLRAPFWFTVELLNRQYTQFVSNKFITHTQPSTGGRLYIINELITHKLDVWSDD